MVENSLLEWLLLQAPVVIVMGVGIWWLARRYTDITEKLEKSQDEKASMAQDMIEFVKIIKEDRDKEKYEKDREMLEIMRDIQLHNQENINLMKIFINKEK